MYAMTLKPSQHNSGVRIRGEHILSMHICTKTFKTSLQFDVGVIVGMSEDHSWMSEYHSWDQ